jgi:hypothetical protein
MASSSVAGRVNQSAETTSARAADVIAATSDAVRDGRSGRNIEHDTTVATETFGDREKFS